MTQRDPIRARDLDLDSSEKVDGPARYTRDVSRHREGAVNPHAMTPAEMMREKGARQDELPDDFEVRRGSSGRKLIAKQPYQIQGTGFASPRNRSMPDGNRISATASRSRSARAGDRRPSSRGGSRKVVVAAVAIVVVIVLVVIASRL